MTVRPIVGALALAIALPAGPCAAAGSGQAVVAQAPAPERIASAREAAEHFMDVLEGVGFSGVALVTVGDQQLLKGAYGSAFDAEGQRATVDTVFDLGSITKQFTAASILLLEQEGKLATTDPIGRHLAGLPAEKAGLTIHQLLTHTSGLGDVHGEDHEAVGKEEALKRIAEQKLLFAPGSSFAYSNSAYTLLAAIIERLSGRPYIEFVRERLFKPAGMTSTGFYNEPLWANRLAFHGYFNGEDQGKVTAMPGPYWTVMGNGEALSTLADMQRWVRFLNDGRLLSKSQLAKMQTGYVTRPNGVRWGYATQVHDLALGEAFGHGGVGAGGVAEAYYLPSRDAVMVLYGNRATIRDMKNPDGTMVVLPAREARDELARIIARELGVVAAAPAGSGS